MVNDVPPGSAPTSNHQGTRVRTKCKISGIKKGRRRTTPQEGRRRNGRQEGKRTTDERKRTTTDDGENELRGPKPPSLDGNSRALEYGKLIATVD